MYIAGIGRTKFGILYKSFPELLYEAMYNALNDSPLRIEDIDAIVVANFLAGNTQDRMHLGALISSLLPGLNLPSFRVEAACASGGFSVYQALPMLKDFENIMVVGAEKLNTLTSRQITKAISLAGDQQRDQREGLIFPAQYAMVALEYFKTYGAMHDDLAQVSLKNYKNAALNPLAHFSYKEITLDMINSSPMISSPLRLFDCCPSSDGAACLILSSRKRSNRDIKIVGVGASSDAISLSQRKVFTSFAAAKDAAKVAYERADLSPEDIDIAEVHDCFTIAELIAMEDLGFCEPGEAAKLVRNGDTSIMGRLPINTDGGLLADGHPLGATGIAQLCEIVRQLRGEAGPRQVGGAKIGLAHNVGGVGGSAVVHIMERS